MRTILLVEDDAAVQKGIRENLERERFRVIVERDGVRGLTRARKEQPDLLILDVMLPGMNGFDICARLKREGFGSPIFMLTALADERRKLQGLGAGADDYLPKPFSIEELLLRVRNALQRTDRTMGRAKAFERELQRAREIQLAALPKRPPRVQGIGIHGTMIPATHVGGDYFDYLSLKPGEAALVVADVSGKGMPAALYVHKMQGIVQASRPLVRTAADILTRLQEHLGSSMEAASFVTAVSALFDMKNRRVEIAGAGHPPVFLKRGTKLMEIRSEGMIIGQAAGREFNRVLKTASLELQTGDVFVFYSDGVTEALNAAQEEFGSERLKQVLLSPEGNARAIASGCLRQIRNFTGNEPQSDDITIVTVKVL